MRERILGELEACEAERNVSVAYAVESGSRCWGFAGNDSDYDVRFVYVRPRDGYLTLCDVRDVIDWHQDDELDVVGWDLSKFLRLLRKSNPSVFEWLDSTIVYRESESFSSVRELSKACFDPVSSARHYYGMAMKHDARYLQNVRCTPKRYLYVVRSLLGCEWSICEQTPVPMAFSELMGSMLEPHMVPTVTELVDSMRSGMGKVTCDNIPALDTWIHAREDTLRAQMDGMRHKKQVPWHEIDSVFIKMLDSEA